MTMKAPYTVHRFHHHPLIPIDDPSVHEEDRFGHINISGPSVIRVPQWADMKLGRYYMYFAHHKGTFIRMAYADRIVGPWKIYASGVLHLADSHFPANETELSKRGESSNSPTSTSDQATANQCDPWAEIMRDYSRVSGNTHVTHIASPDVHVDHENRRFVMTFHGLEGSPRDSSQVSRVATSTNGLKFESLPGIIGFPYFRHFSNPLDSKNQYYVAMPGIFYRSRGGLTNFVCREIGQSGNFDQSRWFFDASMRHSAIRSVPGKRQLHVFWTRVGDAPERILLSVIDLTIDWNNWKLANSSPIDILFPSLEWEGANLEIRKSVRGEINERVRELRDPCIFEDTDGKIDLFYTGAGECNIGVVELIENETL